MDSEVAELITNQSISDLKNTSDFTKGTVHLEEGISYSAEDDMVYFFFKFLMFLI